MKCDVKHVKNVSDALLRSWLLQLSVLRQSHHPFCKMIQQSNPLLFPSTEIQRLSHATASRIDKMQLKYRKQPFTFKEHHEAQWGARGQTDTREGVLHSKKKKEKERNRCANLLILSLTSCLKSQVKNTQHFRSNPNQAEVSLCEAAFNASRSKMLKTHTAHMQKYTVPHFTLEPWCTN